MVWLVMPYLGHTQWQPDVIMYHFMSVLPIHSVTVAHAHTIRKRSGDTS